MGEVENKNEYLPLFRKYRPQSFKDVIGQEFTVQALSNAIKLNKIANAYLFCGPRGTGKTSSARIFAKSLNCEQGPTIEPCQKCQSCLDVTNASGIDVIEIDAATNRGIDDAKELINKVQYAPMNGKYKIFIIDEVHMLSKEAFNALLKTFEEPPKNVIFILATTEPHKVIETIVSRCQRFDFRRITIEDITKRLREISDTEKINITDEALYAIAKNVSGGMRDSLALLDQVSILGVDKEITKETVESLIGKLTFDVLYNLTSLILNKEVKEAVEAVETIYTKGSEPRNFVENYIEFLRNIILAANSKDLNSAADLTLLSKENIEKIKESDLFTQESLIYILDKVIEFYKEIKTSTNPYLWAELMVISCAKTETKNESQKTVSKQVELKPVIKEEASKQEKTEPVENKQTTAKEEIKAEPVVEKTAEPIKVEPTPSAAPKVSGNPAEIWKNIISNIESVPAKFFYSGVGKLIKIDGTIITLGFVNENALMQAKSDNKYKPLMNAIKKILGDNGNIEFTIIQSGTKFIEVNFNSPNQNYVPKQTVTPMKEAPVSNPAAIENISQKEEAPSQTKEDTSNYTRITKEMLEAYNGRVIE